MLAKVQSKEICTKDLAARKVRGHAKEKFPLNPEVTMINFVTKLRLFCVRKRG